MAKFLDRFFNRKADDKQDQAASGGGDVAAAERPGSAGESEPVAAPAQSPARPGMPMGSGGELTVDTNITVPEPEEGMTLEDQVIMVLRQLYDPEIPVNILELGLIYDIQIDEETNDVKIIMTLTSPHCPVAESLPLAVQDSVAMIEGINSVDVEITWDPPWDFNMMTDAARLELGMM